MIKVEPPRMPLSNGSNEDLDADRTAKSNPRFSALFFTEDEEHLKLLKILELQRAHFRKDADSQSNEHSNGLEHVEVPIALAGALHHPRAEVRCLDPKNDKLLSCSGGHGTDRHLSLLHKEHVQGNMLMQVLNKEKPCDKSFAHRLEDGNLGFMKIHDFEDDKPLCKLVNEVKCSQKKGHTFSRQRVKRKNFCASTLELDGHARASADCVLTNQTSCLGDKSLQMTIATENLCWEPTSCSFENDLTIDGMPLENVKIQSLGASIETEKEFQDTSELLVMSRGENVVDAEIPIRKKPSSRIATDLVPNKLRCFAYEELRSFINKHVKRSHMEQLPQAEM